MEEVLFDDLELEGSGMGYVVSFQVVLIYEECLFGRILGFWEKGLTTLGVDFWRWWYGISQRRSSVSFVKIFQGRMIL